MAPTDTTSMGTAKAVDGAIAEKAPAKSGPTSLFIMYCVRLGIRGALFIWGVVLLIVDPIQLDPLARFGFQYGLSYVNVLFVFVVGDIITKFIPSAKIAMGSLKQYNHVHLPTANTLKDGGEQLLQMLRDIHSQNATAASETVEGVKETARSIKREAAALRLINFDDEDLSANEALRSDIRRSRLREIVPVIVFWVVFNLAIAGILYFFGWLNPSTATLWMAFYFMFDMLCVVAWCPLQLLLMRNRCCTTCQIFNWDAIMTATPLVFVGGWFSLIIGGLSIIVLVRWELAFVRHPERFDERTNASLECTNCTDKLCHVRRPIKAEAGKANV